MRLWDLTRGALGALWAHRLRTFLSMFGIAWGVISVTVLVAACQGLADGLKRAGETLGKDILLLSPGRTSLQLGGMRAGRELYWLESDYQLVAEQAPACRYVLPELERSLPVRSLYNNDTVLVTASLPPFAEFRSIGVAQGRFYNDLDVATGQRVAFLGSDRKQQLFGGRPALGQTIWIAGVPYTVIGVMRAKDQDSSYDGFDVHKIYIPFTAMTRDFPKPPPAFPHSIDRLIVVPRSLELHMACRRQAIAALAALHRFDPNDRQAVWIWDTIEDAKANRAMTDGMKAFLGTVGIVTLLLGGIGVMNVMLVSVRERTREIGLRMAVGATRRAIVRQFFAETVIVVLVSGGTGMAISYGLCWLVNQYPMPLYFAGLVLTWRVVLGSVALLAVVALLSGVYPARRAASVDPIEALRFEAGG